MLCDGEVEITQRLEQGEWIIYEALCENPVALGELLRGPTPAQVTMAAVDWSRWARAAGPVARSPRFASLVSTRSANDQGKTDGAEVVTHGTDPLVVDTDSDGIQDGTEVGETTGHPTDTDAAGIVPALQAQRLQVADALRR